MCPTSVVMPVLVTRSVPAPRVTWVFMNARSMRSPRAESAATGSTCLGTGTLSPVNADSSISSVAAVSRRPSAGTRSPASMFTMSPGTSSSIGTEASLPSRRTLAWTISIFWSAATLAFALPSWLRPMAALKRVRPISTTPVATWSGRNRLRMPAASRTTCMGSLYWRTKACQRGSFAASAKRFGPNLARRASTSDAGGPVELDALALQRGVDGQGVPGDVGGRGGGGGVRHRVIPSRMVRRVRSRARAFGCADDHGRSTATVSTTIVRMASRISTGHTNFSQVP